MLRLAARVIHAEILSNKGSKHCATDHPTADTRGLQALVQAERETIAVASGSSISKVCQPPGLSAQADQNVGWTEVMMNQSLGMNMS